MTSNSGSGQTIVVSQANGQNDRAEKTEVAHRVRPKVVQTTKAGRSDKLQRLINYLLAINDQKFTGYIKVNFSQGSIGRIERFEEILSK